MRFRNALYPISGAASKGLGITDKPQWAYRDAKYAGVFSGVDPRSGQMACNHKLVQGLLNATASHIPLEVAYSNFMMDEWPRFGVHGKLLRITTSVGARIKKAVWSHNLFKVKTSNRVNKDDGFSFWRPK